MNRTAFSRFFEKPIGKITVGCAVFATIFAVIYRFIPGIGFLFRLLALALGVIAILFATELVAQSIPKAKMLVKIFRITVYAAILILTVIFIVTEIRIISAEKGDGDLPEDVSVMLILGCGVNGTEPSRMLRLRLDTALEQLEKNPQCTAILCGAQGSGEDISEAECMFRYLTARGISADRLILEDQSFNTRENIQNAAKILQSSGNNPEKIAIVTTDFHLYRSARLAEHEGYTVHTVAADLPNVPLFWLNYHLREFASIFTAYVREIFA